MADYIYLLEHRLSDAQQRAIRTVRNRAREHEFTIFLTGGAVRDLTAGSSVRDLDLTIVGDVSVLRPELEADGALLMGENAAGKALFFLFAGGVRVEVGAAVTVEFPKPGQPVYTPAGISESLRSRDFTANAMALSLNEGSYGLLMDPLNGVADIENRELRLISNYGFLDDPTRMLRAVRLGSRLGWHMEERTQQRYENAKAEDLMGSASAFNRGYELEEIFYEEDPTRIMRALDAEGWLTALSPQLASAKPNDGALADLREKQGQLLTQGVLADAATLALPMLLGKLSAADADGIKASFARGGFAQQVDSLEARTRELQTRFASKEAATPSAAWRILHEAEPELVLSMLFHAKGAVQSRLKTFLTDSPTARQRIPYATLQEMRITPDLPGYTELLDKLFFELMDGKLTTPEEMKAFLEPYSPPAPPPPVNLRRARAKKEARPSRAKAKKAVAPETVTQQDEALGTAEGLMEPGTLTGPDRGTEPTVETPLAGKVAPLAPGESEPAAKKPARTAKMLAVMPDAESPVAEAFSGQAAPVTDRKGRAATTPHPLAQEVASMPAVLPTAQAGSASNAAAAVNTGESKAKPAKTGTEVSKASKGVSEAKAAKQVSPAVSAPAAKKQPSPAQAVPATKQAAAPSKPAPQKTAPKPSTTSTVGAKTGRAVSSPAAKSSAKSPSSATAKSPVKAVGKTSVAKTAPAKAGATQVARNAPPTKAAAKKTVAPAKAATKTAAKATGKVPVKATAKSMPAKAVAAKAAKSARKR